MKKINITLCLFFVLFISSCSDEKGTSKPIVSEDFIRAADMSFLPLAESEGTIYKSNNTAQDALITLKNSGCNYIRVRLWHNPINATSSLNEVKTLANRIRQNGMKVWLTVHYSDTWADPGNQLKPAAWSALNFTDLKTAVYDYTTMVVNEINPDIIQIGNEINDGFIYPEGKISTSIPKFTELLKSAVSAVRNASTTSKIMIHHAGIDNAELFFSKVKYIDFDYIGLSYYPFWHGKNTNKLNDKITYLGENHNKKVIVAEIAYPFSLSYNDFTNNIVGQNDQLITDFPATPEGQKNFLKTVKDLVKQNTYGQGFCYWGSEWVAFRGPTSANGSPWENQALWDFNNNALPVMEAFNEN